MPNIPFEQPPAATDPEMIEYLTRQFILIGAALDGSAQLDISTAIPAKPQVGKLYYFANTVGAITSIGYWGYTSTGWKLMS